MKAVIFYISGNERPGRQKIVTTSGRVTWVRAEEVVAKDLLDALDHAAPDADESVMNAHRMDS